MTETRHPSIDQSRVAARRVHEHFNTKNNPMSLEEAQEMAAYILGYESWSALASWAGKGERFLPDECLHPWEQEVRLFRQAVNLTNINGGMRFHHEQLVQQLRLTAENPSSDRLAYNPWTTNQMSHTASSGTGKTILLGRKGWRFRPSLRSERALGTFRDRSSAYWEEGSITFEQYNQYLKALIQRQPENIFALTEVIHLHADITGRSPNRRRVEQLERAMREILPFGIRKEDLEGDDENYVAGRMETYEGYNRDFKGAVYILATALYVLKEYEAAGEWFRASLRINDCNAFDREYFYLADLAGLRPKGDVHKSEWGPAATQCRSPTRDGR
ncbi:hypothetical protein [Alcanivorax sp. 1008]|uniref:hypothetical protein n=1 Tax=Alcanivorax sp. 1008 TaxID=2816853 RepID=UPI001D5C205F|nr:hypothetical protein [Alcanivorax sp. 1008]MCC1496766.1 hypothetical protein [Alcanivorax sp. 1008]